MITEVSGDILLTKAQTIVHGVAPNDHFTSGLAHALRESWPALAKDFRHFCHQQAPKPGELFFWGGPQVRVVNLLLQEAAASEHSHPGKASLSNLRHALDALVKLTKAEKLTSLALPKLGCGVGGLKWEEVFPIIKEKLSELGIPVFVYSDFKPGVAANEKV